MTDADVTYYRLFLLTQAIREKGQAQAARELGYSDAAICQVVKGSYKGDAGRILQRVAEVYGTETTPCPILGAITLGRCAEERKKAFSSASPLRLRLWKACQSCPPSFDKEVAAQLSPFDLGPVGPKGGARGIL